MLILLVVLSSISILFNIALVFLVRDLKKKATSQVVITVESIKEEPSIESTIREEYKTLRTYFSTWDQYSRNKKSSFKRAYAVWTSEETRLLKKYVNDLDIKTLSKLHQRSVRSLTSQLASIRY